MVPSLFNFFHLILFNPSFLFFSPLSFSAQTLGKKRQSLSVRSEQDFQIKPCHFASHWGPRPSMTSADSCAAVATSNLRLRKQGRWEGGEEKSKVQSRHLKCEGFTTPAKHYICVRHLSLAQSSALFLFSSPFLTNCLVKRGKWWMLQRNEGGKERKSHADPLGTQSTSGSLSETTLWWPLKCLSGSNLNPGRQTQYPDQKKPVLLHS